MKKFFGEFKKFIARGNVLDMSVGVIVGGAFTGIVNGLSNFILKPIINWILSLIIGANGLDKVYTYAGFEIQTYPIGEKDFVYMIILQDDTVATEKGIRIGATKDAVLTAYGTPNEESANALTYNGKGMYLQFILREGTVTSIQYGYAE